MAEGADDADRWADTRDEQDETMRRMWAEGKSSTQIAKAIGVTRNVVIGRMRRKVNPKQN